ncbi:hypothetical protein [Pseudothermotoga sp.]|uniref:hypothetical protein n=1 Tax=Pseudothermotoga sp. TaxID=2033661 RepID=UPI000E90B6C1|nr:hypothetical protein [Pseudothermotoga sp.]HBJ81674.1 hypothetical protein [Pseudothermotoga sp.]
MPYTVFENPYAEYIDVYWAPNPVSKQTGLKPSVNIVSAFPVKLSGSNVVPISNADIDYSDPNFNLDYYGVVFHTVSTSDYAVVIKRIPGVEVAIKNAVLANVVFSAGDSLYWSTLNSKYTNAVNKVTGETPTGVTDGVNKTFTTLNQPIVAGTLSILVDGTTSITDNGDGTLSDGGTVNYATGEYTLAVAPATSVVNDYEIPDTVLIGKVVEVSNDYIVAEFKY